MKRSRKSLVSLILAVMMIAAMAVSALAGTIQISNNTSGNTFSVYKVMSAVEAGEDNDRNKLYTFTVEDAFKGFFENNAAGYGLNAQNEITLNGTVLTGDARTTNTNDSDAARLATALAKYAREKTIAATATITDTTATSDLGLGFFVVAQTASADKEDKEVASKPILLDLTQGNAAIAAKKDTTTLEKVILEDSKELKANNVNIGDTVDYKIKTRIPTYEANVDKDSLHFVLTDTFSAGLTYQEDLEIAGFTAGTEYTAAFEGGVLTITFTKQAIYDHQGEDVVATYSAKLNENAIVDSEAGNPNTVELEYTNNPDEENNYKTLEDETKTYTYGFKLHKVDKAAPSENLGDAKFTLQNSDGKYAQFDVDGTVYTFKGFVDSEDDATEIVSSEAAQVTVKGLDTGSYTLTETEAPDKYTKLAEPVIVTIKDDGEENGTDHKPNGKAIITAAGGGNAKPEGGADVTDDDGNVTGKVENNNGSIDLAVYVENAKGISLPETGATSALVCMIGGALIVLIGLLYYVLAVRRSKVSR